MSDRGIRQTNIGMAATLRKVFDEVFICGDIEADPDNGLTGVILLPDTKTKTPLLRMDTPASSALEQGG
jgi:hypothetical protein